MDVDGGVVTGRRFLLRQYASLAKNLEIFLR